MKQYLYNTPQIVNDTIFLLYGGQTGTSSQAQRDIAYTLAEEQMVEYLTSYLTPTIVTGTYLWRGENPLELDYGWIIRVLGVTAYSLDGSSSCTLSGDSTCSQVRNAQYGYLDVYKTINCGGCGGIVSPPYNIQVVHESGFSSGTYLGKSMLQALTIASQINLNEIDVSLSNESIADAGIEFFINQGYHEKRKKTGSNTFGNSAMANRIGRLVKKYKARPSMGFR